MSDFVLRWGRYGGGGGRREEEESEVFDLI